VPSTDDRVCSDCGRAPLETLGGAEKRGDIFVEMKPGRDGNPWWLCLRCIVEAAKAKERKPPSMVSGEFAGALIASGWQQTSNGDGTVTISPPERITNPPKRRRARA